MISSRPRAAATGPTTRNLSRSTALLAAGALTLVGVLTAVPAQAAVADVSTLDGIQQAWDAGDAARLTADITAGHGTGLLATGSSVTLDLNGHTLAIPKPQHAYAAITVPVKQTLTVTDSAGGGTLVATGGNGGPGIGGAASNWGHKNCGSVVIDGGHLVVTGGAGGPFGSPPSGPGAAIGSGGVAQDNTAAGRGCNLTVNGGWLQATGGVDPTTGAGAPAIGSGNGNARTGSLPGSGGSLTLIGSGSATPLAAGYDPGATGQAGGTPTPTVSAVAGRPFTLSSSDATATSAATSSIRYEYGVTFDTAGGSTIADQTVAHGATVTPVTTSRAGFTFAGWHVGTPDGREWTTSTPVTTSTVVVASWTAVPVTPPVTTPVPPPVDPPVTTPVPPPVDPPVTTPVVPPVTPAPTSGAATGSVALTGSAGDVAGGRTVRVVGQDMAPGSTWTVTMYSTPVVLGSGTVPATGTLSTSVVLPADVPAGSHRLELTGTGADGTAVVATSWFGVTADGTITGTSPTGPVPAPVQLAATGVAPALLLGVGSVLLVAGVAALTLGRRRRTTG